MKSFQMQNPVLSQAETTKQNDETMSQYVAKSKQRGKSAKSYSRRSTTSSYVNRRADEAMKVFYPQEYFKHAGYQMERQERFNEPLESQSRQSKKDECLSVLSKATSQKNKEKSKQKIIEKLNSLDDRD